MADNTANFGFTRVGDGEDLSKNGYAALDTDRVMMDDLLLALLNHNHDAAARLADPDVAPDLTVANTGGVIPANATLYYKISYLDKFGLETAGGPEETVTTPLGIDAPSAPTVTVEATGGTLVSGTYAYSVTVVDITGGETTASPYTQAQVTASGTSRIRVLLAPLPPNGDHMRIYRAKPGQTAQYLLDDNITDTTYYDDGSVAEDQSIVTPELNTTGSTCSVTISLPGATPTLPEGVASWKIYRALSPGGYDQYNLVHHVVEPTTQYSGDVRATWVDDGTELNLGIPRTQSATVSGGRIVTLADVTGSLPLAVMPRGARSISTVVSTLADGVTFYRTSYPASIQPTAITAFFRGAPSGLNGSNQIHIHMLDSAATPNAFELVCSDDSGYYVANFPLTLGGRFEAESGPREGVTSTPIINDPNATNGQVVELNEQNEYALVVLGTLDPGTYTPTVSVIEADPGYAHPNNDLQLRVIELDVDNTFLSDISDTNFSNSGYTNAGYSVLTGSNFVLTSPTKVGLALMKRTTTDATYWVDHYTYAAVLPALSAGDLSLECTIDGAPSSVGSDVAVTVWF